LNIDAFFFVLCSAMMLIIFLGFIVWGYLSGQFRDVEKKKWDLSEEDEE
jgi:nitrogen fixation-related uncharacterized protein